MEKQGSHEKCYYVFRSEEQFLELLTLGKCMVSIPARNVNVEAVVLLINVQWTKEGSKVDVTTL